MGQRLLLREPGVGAGGLGSDLGGTHTAYSQFDVDLNIASAATSMSQWDTAMSGFLDTWSVCP